MTDVDGTTIVKYARAIEREWFAFIGAAGILSPKDWALISEWHSRGIPLAIVREAIDGARERAKRRSRRGPPRGLSYLAAAIDESWSAVQDGRVEQFSATVAPDFEPDSNPGLSLAQRFRSRAKSEDDGSALATALLQLARRLENGEMVETVEAVLDAKLLELVPAIWIEEANAEIEARIGQFRTRMRPGTFKLTRQKALIESLRRRTGLLRTN